MSLMKLKTPNEIHEKLSFDFKMLRLSRQMTQAELARKAGISLMSLKRFEQGKPIASEKLVKLLYTLDADHVLETMFASILMPKTMEELEKSTSLEKRVRKAHEKT